MDSNVILLIIAVLVQAYIIWAIQNQDRRIKALNTDYRKELHESKKHIEYWKAKWETQFERNYKLEFSLRRLEKFLQRHNQDIIAQWREQWIAAQAKSPEPIPFIDWLEKEVPNA